jgi:hypothetical protein
MLFLTRPAAAKKMLDDRLKEAGDAVIITYCGSCVESFRGAGRESYHLLEALFNQKVARSFGNRIRNARRCATRLDICLGRRKYRHA